MAGAGFWGTPVGRFWPQLIQGSDNLSYPDGLMSTGLLECASGVLLMPNSYLFVPDNPRKKQRNIKT